MIPDAPHSGTAEWLDVDGAPISCREKIKVLDENRDELAQVMRDAFEDAILMGVDEASMRRMLSEMVAALRSPLRDGTK